MSEEVKRRVEALRKAKEDELYAAECKRNDELIQWEAEMVIELEEYTNERIMNDLTDDMDIYECLAILIRKINCYKLIKLHVRHTGSSDTQFIKQNISREDHAEIVFKMKYLFNHITILKNSPEYLEKERLRKEKISEDKAKKEEEERIINEKAFQEEQMRRQQILNETNNAINRIIQNVQHTFTNLNLSDWDKRNEKQFIYYNKQCGWTHMSVDTNNKRTAPCYTGMPSSFVSYYEEGKVPFLTKCPTCKCPTQFNYMNKQYASGFGGHESQKSCSFKEVYCNKHYFYDSSTNKHYVTNPSGITLNLNHPKEGAWVVICWNPSNNNATKWVEWDPSDPDGVKAAAAAKKQKEAEEIQRQIVELQAKLASLQT